MPIMYFVSKKLNEFSNKSKGKIFDRKKYLTETKLE